MSGHTFSLGLLKAPSEISSLLLSRDCHHADVLLETARACPLGGSISAVPID